MRKKAVLAGFCLTLFLGISLGAQAESTIKEFSAITTGVKELSIKAYLLPEFSEPGVEVNAVIRNLTVVADKSVPESMFDITQSNLLTPSQ